MGNQFGHELRRRRTGAQMSVRMLAAAASCSIGHISKLENGHRHPTTDMAAALDRALQANGQLSVLAGHDKQEDDVDRRAVLRALAAAGMTVAGWTVSPEPSRAVGVEHLADIENTIALYRGWVVRHGGAAIRQPTAALLERACALHAQVTAADLRQRFLAAIADVAGLGAYVARDVGDHTGADGHAQIALSAAAAAGDTALGGHIVTRMAGHCIELRQPSRSLAYLDVVDHKRPSDANGRANRMCIAAWAYAQNGDVQAVHCAVGRAEDAFDETAPAGSGWAAQHVTKAELLSLTGAAYVELARRNPAHATEATSRLTQALDLRADSLGRHRVLDQISMAEALWCAGEIDGAGQVATQAVREAAGIASGRLHVRLDELTRRFEARVRDSDDVALFVGLRSERRTKS